MTNQINYQSVEDNILSSDDKLGKGGGVCWNIEQYRKNIETNYGDDDDWFTLNDDNICFVVIYLTLYSDIYYS